MGWTAAIGITLLAFFLRVWKLGTPRQFAFDETYYAKDAWSLLNHGYVRSYVGDANEKILDGTTTGIWKDEPSMIVHPEVGKWLIALGEHFFGMDPFGWRIASAVVGSLMVAGDVPARAAADRLDRPGLRRRPAALLRRPALRAVPTGAARHLHGVLPALRRGGPGQRPRLVPRAGWPGSARNRWPTRRGFGPVRGPALPAVAAGRRRLLRARGRDEVDRAVPDGRVRPAGLGLELGRPPVVRGALAGAEVGR